MDSSTKRAEVQRRILQNLRNDIAKCFQKYRSIGDQENNQKFRQKLFRLLKTEIINSLNDDEKVDLLKNIADKFQIYGPVITGQPDFDYYPNSYTDPIFQSSNDNPFDDLISTSYANEVEYVSKSVTRRCDEINEKDLKDSEEHDKKRNESTTSDHVKQEVHEEVCSQVEKTFHKLTNIILKDEDIVEAFEKIKMDHGEDVYRQTILYIPVNKPGISSVTEPILFQLAIKVEQYETALDKLLTDKLLILTQKNQYKISIFNALLFKSFDVLFKFLSYIQKKNIGCDIHYIISRSDNSSGLENATLDNESSSDSGNEDSNKKEISEDVKIPLSEYSPSAQFLMNNGILYCRYNLKNSSKENFSSLIQKLKSLNLLEPVLNEKIENENTYINYLANEYPKSHRNILQILREDETLILRSSFFVALATKDICDFYEFLKSLVVELKINKKVVCDLCKEITKDGKSISLMLINYRGRANAVKMIQEFIEKYGSCERD